MNDVLQAFKKFAFREMPMAQYNSVPSTLMGGIVTLGTEDAEPLLNEMFDEAAKYNKKLRLWLPNVPIVGDGRDKNRINIRFYQDLDNNWRISPNITLG